MKKIYKKIDEINSKMIIKRIKKDLNLLLNDLIIYKKNK
jgi:hypothetical protein